MKRTIVLGMLAGLLLVGCSDKEKEQALEQQLNQRIPIVRRCSSCSRSVTHISIRLSVR